MSVAIQRAECDLLRERLRAADESAETIADRVREIADNVLGLQPADAATVVLLDMIERAYHRECIARSQAEVSLARVVRQVASLLEETGEYDDDGAFVPAPRASLSGRARDDITAWPEYRAAWERASRAVAIGAALSPEAVSLEGALAAVRADERRRCEREHGEKALAFAERMAELGMVRP